MSIMFVAKFSQVNGTSVKFTPNKHGQMPFIGAVVAGIAAASIIDAAVFEGNKLTEGSLYLCENGEREYEGKVYPTVDVICPVSPLDFIAFRKELGMGQVRVQEVRELADANL
jgi:hypothetical protein